MLKAVEDETRDKIEARCDIEKILFPYGGLSIEAQRFLTQQKTARSPTEAA